MRRTVLVHVDSRCPEKTGEKHQIYSIVFIACDESLNMSSASTSKEETEVSLQHNETFLLTILMRWPSRILGDLQQLLLGRVPRIDSTFLNSGLRIPGFRIALNVVLLTSPLWKQRESEQEPSSSV